MDRAEPKTEPGNLSACGASVRWGEARAEAEGEAGVVDTGVGRQRSLHAAGAWYGVVWWRGSLYLRLHIALCATFEAREVHRPPYPCGDLHDSVGRTSLVLRTLEKDFTCGWGGGFSLQSLR